MANSALISFENVKINGTKSCRFTWNQETNQIDFYAPNGFHDHQLRAEDILDLDTSRMVNHKLRLALMPNILAELPSPTFDTLLKVPLDSEGKPNNPFDYEEGRANAGLGAPDLIPKLEHASSILKTMKLGFSNGTDFDEFIKLLIDAKIIKVECYKKRSISNFFFSTKKYRFVGQSRPECEIQLLHDVGLFADWKKKKY